MLKKFANFIFYGNYYLGFCTVFLAMEGNLQQGISLNSVFFYLLLYLGTVLFYTHAYIQESNGRYINERTKWYTAHAEFIKRSQLILFFLCLLLSIYLCIKYYHGLLLVTPLQIGFLIFIAVLAQSYYGISIGRSFKVNTRQTGWLKPFVISLVWTTAVTFAPVVWRQAELNTLYIFTQVNLWFFIKNFMFISILAIMFDIKDYAADHNRKLKTFVVNIGLRKTLFLIIMPIALLAFLSFIIFAWQQHFPPLKIIFNCLPFITLLYVIRSMQRRKSIIYYLAVIDGLLIVKAICGITASIIIK